MTLRAYLKVSLLVVVVLGQTALFAHELDQRLHQPGESCHLCLLSAPLHGGPPAVGAAHFAPGADVLGTIAGPPLLVPQPIAAAAARAPPAIRSA